MSVEFSGIRLIIDYQVRGNYIFLNLRMLLFIKVEVMCNVK